MNSGKTSGKYEEDKKEKKECDIGSVRSSDKMVMRCM